MATAPQSTIHNPQSTIHNPRSTISFINDRPGHDSRYAINTTKTRSDPGWQPTSDFQTSLRKLVRSTMKNGH